MAKSEECVPSTGNNCFVRSVVGLFVCLCIRQGVCPPKKNPTMQQHSWQVYKTRQVKEGREIWERQKERQEGMCTFANKPRSPLPLPLAGRPRRNGLSCSGGGRKGIREKDVTGDGCSWGRSFTTNNLKGKNSPPWTRKRWPLSNQYNHSHSLFRA